MNVQPHPRPSRLIAGLASSLLLCLLALALSQTGQTAYSQGIDPSAASGASAIAATPTPSREACVGAGTPMPTPPGDQVRMIGDDEIFVSYTQLNDSKALRTVILDNAVDSTQLTQKEVAHWTGLANVAQINDLSNAAADLAGDHKAELVSTYADITGYLGALSWYPAVNYGQWTTNNGDYKPESLADAGAGDFDGDGKDEIAIAFRDTDNDYRVAVLKGNSTGGFSTANNNVLAAYHNDVDEQGNSAFQSIAVGDVNGDGKDEIIIAFQDGGLDLNVSILAYDGTSTLKSLWFWNDRDNGMDHVCDDETGIWKNVFPIDVAAGDLDGDFMDEVVVAARIGDDLHSAIQLIALDVTHQTTTPLTIDTTLWTNYAINAWDYYAANVVSVATGDFDGDGEDEIALAYNRTFDSGDKDPRWDHHLVTFEYVTSDQPEFPTACAGSTSTTACFKQRSGSLDTEDRVYPGSVPMQEWHVAIATGDLDRDNRDEIGMVRFKFEGGANEVEVRAYDADDGLVLRGTPWTTDLGTNQPSQLWITMGDRDGDSVWGDYVDNSCWVLKEAHLLTVLYAPPHWPEGHPAENYGTAGSSFDQESLDQEGDTTETSCSIGSSVETKIPIKKFKISFTRGWEKEAFASQTSSTSQSQGKEWATCPAELNSECAKNPSYNGVEFIEVKSRCYTYADKTGTTGDVDACLPWSKGENRFSQNWWYTFGPVYYPESWTPVGVNLAQGRTAKMSNQDTGYPTDPQRAVDGNTDGVYNNNSVVHTGLGSIPGTSFWEVDLGGDQWIGGVQIWNRTDSGYTGHLKDFYVFVSKEEFEDANGSTTTNNVNDLRNDTTIWKKYVSGEAGRATIVPVNTEGRYVRVQLFGPDANPGDAYGAGGAGISATTTTWLDMAELQVYGMPGAVDQWPTARPTAGTDSFSLTWAYAGKALTQQVPGTLLGSEVDDPSAVKPTSLKVVLNLGFGQSGEFEAGGSTSSSRSLGMAYRRAREVTVTESEKYSHITNWDKSIGFHAEIPGLPAALCTTPLTCDNRYNYQAQQFAWQQTEISNQSFRQAFLVQGFWVPLIGSAAAPPADVSPEGAAPAFAGPVAQPDVKPGIPVITSPTHPDPTAWVNNSTATTNWAQPAGDPATVAGYHWLLNRKAGTVPYEENFGLTKTDTHENLSDGVWYMHVRAVSSDGQWSDTAHRAIQVDTNPPELTLVVDPPASSGDDGWYIRPATVTLTATDGKGSGVAKLEYSTNGTTWQPYTAPLVFSSDTAGTTVYARATDIAGLVSDPVSTLFKIDRTAPNSHVTGGAGAGAYVAEVVTNALGNEELLLASAVKDDASTISSMNVAWDGQDATTVELGAPLPVAGLPGITANWHFTATHQIGVGYHIFSGSALDGAGNAEPPYEIARVVWYPKAAPDLSGSSMHAAHSAIRPGDTVLFTIVARNAGWQEAHVSVVDTLPAGLTPVLEILPANVTYNPDAGTLTWPAKLLWPGQAMQHSFEAQAASGLSYQALENRATLHAAWPNTNLLSDAERQKFTDKEQMVTVKASVKVDPALPAGADRTAPWVVLMMPGQDVTTGPELTLGIPAAQDATRMYLREWTLDPMAGNWIVAKSSGWMAYARNTIWTLSAGQGVHYLGVWAADEAGNVSALNELSLASVNRMDAGQALAAGARVQYRGFAKEREQIGLVLKTLSGDPDMYVWTPRSAFRPDGYTDVTAGPGEVEGFGYTRILKGGRFLVEVGAVGASEYAFGIEGSASPASTAAIAAAKTRPDHPLAVSDPLSAGQVGPAVTLENKSYLPVIFRSN